MGQPGTRERGIESMRLKDTGEESRMRWDKHNVVENSEDEGISWQARPDDSM